MLPQKCIRRSNSWLVSTVQFGKNLIFLIENGEKQK